jgi:hypothetical protein
LDILKDFDIKQKSDLAKYNLLQSDLDLMLNQTMMQRWEMYKNLFDINVSLTKPVVTSFRTMISLKSNHTNEARRWQIKLSKQLEVNSKEFATSL